MSKVLLIEKDEQICVALRLALEQNGRAVIGAASTTGAMDALSKDNLELIVAEPI